MPATITITRWKSLTDSIGKREVMTYADLLDEMQRRMVDRHDGSGWSPGTFAGDHRMKEKCRELFAVGLDSDKSKLSIDALAAMYKQHCGFIHTTRRHKSEAPRYRVVLMLTREMTSAEQPRIWSHLNVQANAAGLVLDGQTKDASRLWYYPCAPNAGGAGEFRVLDGAPIDPDELLEQIAANAARAKKTTTEKKPTNGSTNTSTNSTDVEKFIDGKVDEVRGAQTGEGNPTLSRVAYCLAGLAAGERLSEESIKGRLRSAVAHWDNLDHHLATLKRQWDEGAGKPWTWTERGTREREPADEESGRPGPTKRRSFMNTDLGNAERLVAKFGDDIRYVPGLGWFAWTGKRWERDETGTVVRMMKRTARSIYSEAAHAPDEHTAKAIAAWAAKSESRDRIAAAIALASTEESIVVTAAQLDADPMLLNAENGTIDLRVGEMRPHSREDLITKIAGTAFDPKMATVLWDAFLERVLPDADVRAFMQRWAGYCLTASAAEHCLVFAYGTGRNGKGVYLLTTRKMLGGYAVKAPRGLLVAKHNESHPTELMVLRGARFAWCSEIDEKAVWDEAKVKDLTSEDPISAHYMRCDDVEFTPTHKLNIAGNYKPKVSGDDEGIWSRLVVVPFNVTIPEAERDTTLPARLEAELPGILAWAVRGCVEWQRSGLGRPKAVVDATATYRDESDIVGRFIAEKCIVLPGASVAAGIIYKTFVGWCEAQGERAPSQRRFSTSPKIAPFKTDDRNGSGQFLYRGIGLLVVPSSEASEASEATWGLNELGNSHVGRTAEKVQTVQMVQPRRVAS